MDIRIICFTASGAEVSRKLSGGLEKAGESCRIYGTKSCAAEEGIESYGPSLKDWVGQMWQQADGIIFVSASGIAVRSIAPFVQDKTRDPAVLVIDDGGQFVISLLSGHIGGGNELTSRCADILQSVPVITTATDVHNTFAVDLFAKKNRLAIADMKLAKKVSALLLDGKEVGLSSDFPVNGKLPDGVVPGDDLETGICISAYEERKVYPETLQLIPPAIVVGIGCRRGTSFEQIDLAVKNALKASGISIRSMAKAASIDLKENEQGLLEFCRLYNLRFSVYTADELKQLPGAFEGSAFVQGVTGVDNVCERAAVMAGGKLIAKKRAENGVTVAVGTLDWSVDFE